MLKKLIPFIIIVSIAVTLLNSNAFGFDSLIAYFFYTFCVSILSIFVFTSLLFHQKPLSLRLPIYLIIFLILSAYIFIHGLINNNVGLPHYYWVTNALFFTSIYYWIKNQNDNVEFIKTSDYKFLIVRIITLAFIESVIVLLQCFQIFPVPSQFFLCTGTWSNPNVIAMFLALSLFAVFKIKVFVVKKNYWLITQI